MMRSDTYTRRMFNLSVTLALILAFIIGFQTSGLVRLLSEQDKLPQWAETIASALAPEVQAAQGIDRKDLQVFYEVLNIISQSYLRRDEIKSQDLIRGASAGAVDSIGDRYSRFVLPQDQKNLTEEITGEYAGIGVSIIDRPMVLPPWPLECEISAGADSEDPKFFKELRGVTIVRVFENGPAFENGLKPDDVVVLVDGNMLRGKTADDAASLIKGPPNTKVTLCIWRPSLQKELNLDITRKVVHVPTIGRKEIFNNSVGYIRLDTFNSLSPQEINNALEELKAQGMKGLVFDLRNNTGGPMDAAIAICDIFVPDGNLVIYEDSMGNREEFSSKDGGAALNMPLVILTNGNTASSSEIVCGAVRDTHNGILLGENTYGKGVVQNVYQLSDGSGLVLTTGRYLTPAEHEITQDGLAPDIVSHLDLQTLREKDPEIDSFLNKLDSITKEYQALRQQMFDYLDKHDFQKELAIKVVTKWLEENKKPDLSQFQNAGP